MIAHLEPPSGTTQGDQIYRTLQPCRALAELDDVAVISGCWLSRAMREAAEVADVLVLCKVVDFDLLPLLAQRRSRRLVTVYEINDDFTDIQDWNPLAGFWRAPENRSLAIQLARGCDGLQVTTPHLKQRFGHLNSECRVFPNQLSEAPPPLRERHGAPRVGWAGSLGHRDDLRSIVPVLARLLQRHEELTLSFMAPPALMEELRGLPQNRIEYQPSDTLDRYLQFVESLDVGLAPLLPTSFNDGRSDVKFLEYASRGALAVCAKAPPYLPTVRHGDNGLLFDDTCELETLLDSVLRGDIDRDSIALRAYLDVSTSRIEHHHVRDRHDYYQTLIEGTRRSEVLDSAEKEEAAEQARANRYRRAFSSQTPGAQPPACRHRHVALGDTEKHLHNALRSGCDAEASLHHLRSALRCDPDSPLAHLHLGRAVPGKRQEWEHHFERAGEISPHSCNAPFFRAQRLHAGGFLEDARRWLLSTVSLCPDHAVAWELLGILAEGVGDSAEAERCFERAVVANPDFARSAHRLARTYRATHRLREAAEALERSIALGVAGWQERYELGEIYLEQGRPTRAIHHLECAYATTPERRAIGAVLARACLDLGRIDRARALVREHAIRTAPGVTP